MGTDLPWHDGCEKRAPRVHQSQREHVRGMAPLRIITVNNGYKKEHIPEIMLKCIEDCGSPFSTECPPVLHNFVTIDVMTEKIINDVLSAHEKSKKK